MELWKRLAKGLLFPHIAIMILLVPVSIAFLVYSMVVLGTESAIAIISYVTAAYTLTVWCFKIPYLIRLFSNFKNDNKYARRWLEDERLRVNVSLFGSLVWNVAYAMLQLGLGFFHKTVWFYSFAIYYVFLAVMRFFLVRHTAMHKPGERMREELIKYRACGWIFLVMNLALSVIVFFMVYWNRTFEHGMITAIAMAAYTFTAFTVAIVNIVKYRKYNSPIYSASKAINLAAACVSMLTLTSTMLTTFSDGTLDSVSRKLILGGVGLSVSVVILLMAINMIVQGTKKLKLLYEDKNG